MLRLGIAAALLGVLAVPAQAGPRERNFWEWLQDPNGAEIRFQVQVLLLTPKEVEYFRHGGILHYVLRQLATRKAA